MKYAKIMLIRFIIGCIVLLQSGCQEQAELPEPAGLQTREAKSLRPRITKTQVKPETAKPPVISGPVITFKKTVYDFGEVSPSSSNKCEFKFKNEGNELLKIDKVTKTCGCTPYELKKMEYAPGEEGLLKIRYHAANKASVASKHLTVKSNAKNNPIVKLTIKAKIVPKITFEPKSLKLLLKKENAGCPEIKLRSLDGKPFAVTKIKSSYDVITADFAPERNATEFVLQPKVNMGKLNDTMNGRIQIWLTHPDTRFVTVNFETLPEFKVIPASLFVFNAEPQKPQSRQIWISNNYSEDFEIESVDSENGITKVLKKQKEGDRYKLELEINPPAIEEDKKTFKDILDINIKDAEKLKLSLSGFYSKSSSK